MGGAFVYVGHTLSTPYSVASLGHAVMPLVGSRTTGVLAIGAGHPIAPPPQLIVKAMLAWETYWHVWPSAKTVCVTSGEELQVASVKMETTAVESEGMQATWM